MAIQILPQYSWAEREAQKPGLSLADALTGYAQNRFNKMQADEQKAAASSFWQGQGLSPQESKAIASQPIQLQQQYLKDRSAAQQRASSAQSLSSFFNPAQAAEGGAPGQPGQANPQDLQAGLAGLPIQEQQYIAKMLETRKAEEAKANRFETHEKGLTERALKTEIRESKRIVKPEIDAINNDFKAAENRHKNFGQIQKANESGNLPNPTLYSWAEKFGLQRLLETPDAATLNALLTEEFSSIKPDFGGNPSAAESLLSLTRSPANLKNTQWGRRALLGLGELKYQKSKLYRDEANRLVKEYDQKKEPYPLNFAAVAAENVQPKIDKLFDEFNNKVLTSKPKVIDPGSLINTKSINLKDYENGVFRHPKTGERMRVVNGKLTAIKG